MSKILAIKPVTSKDGRPFVLVTTADRDIWITRKQWKGHGNTEVFDAYVGGSISTDYYQKGDLLLDGVTVCDESDRILRDFSAAMNVTVTASIAAQVIANQSAEAEEMANMFAKRRAAETPEQKEARLKAAADARAARLVQQPANPLNA